MNEQERNELMENLHTEIVATMETIKDIKFELNNLEDKVATTHQIFKQLKDNKKEEF